MRKVALFMPFVLAAGVWAEEPARGGAEKAEENPSVPEFIFHHVSDASELDIEVPLLPEKNIHIGLPQILIPFSAGACEAYPAVHGFSLLQRGCLDLSITKHTMMMWLALLLLVLAMVFGSNRDKTKLVPRGTGQNLLEMMVLFIRDEIAVKNIGKKDGLRFTPYLLTIFFFILFMNLLGLIPEMATATGNLAITCGLALCTFVVTQYASIRAAGLGGYLKHLTGGVHPVLWPIMVPVEVLGLFTKPFALTVRLFANMLAGHIVIFFLLGLIFILGSPLVAGVSVPFAMAIYFLELFVALVQAYIFTMLSSLFIGMGVAMGHHGHDDTAHPAKEGEPGHAAAH
jgi:F-type H+-transporting ATPase subunit a